MRSPAQSALRFTASSPAAVVLTVWPSGTGELATVRAWLEGAAARIVHEQPVPLKTQLAELLMVMALYEGEEWVETNCWYSEQPLPTGAPEGPYAGAKWKRALCFRNAASREPHCFVLDTALCSTSLWADKYRLRAKLARESGNPGNSCVHLTDNQAGVLARRGAAASTSGGMSCDESFGFSCARALLHPASFDWINRAAEQPGLELGSPAFRAAWHRYAQWLAEPTADATEEGEWTWPVGFDALANGGQEPQQIS